MNGDRRAVNRLDDRLARHDADTEERQVSDPQLDGALETFRPVTRSARPSRRRRPRWTATRRDAPADSLVTRLQEPRRG